MSKNSYYLAVDLGATSGRTILGRIEDGRVELKELTRFGNQLISMCGFYYWDIFALYQEVIRGLQEAHKQGVELQSIGIDTWGCDFVCIGSDGLPLRNPLAYRDAHTVPMMEQFFEKCMSREDVYRHAGIQLMNFNSIFQLYAMRERHDSAYEQADSFLFTPDALAYLLTGRKVCEYTIASTSDLLNPSTGDLDKELLGTLGLSRDKFGEMVLPGTRIGTLSEEVQQLTGCGAIPVVAVAGHDTASAVAAIPASDEHFAYLSSGTWSLMGIESPHAIINQRSYELNFTNEGGIDGTTTFLKNICGMWLYESCRKEWPETQGMSHAQLQDEAAALPENHSFIDPDDARFANPRSMVKAIQDYCREHDMPVPEGRAQLCRCIFDSLARRYAETFKSLREFSPVALNVLHIIGGGSKNEYLNQLTADECGVIVKAGPQEGTALGNIMLQAKAAGVVSDRWQMRQLIANSVDLKIYYPKK